MKRKYQVRVEHANGQQFNLSKWCKEVLKQQDMEAWKAESPQLFRLNVAAWVKGQLTIAIENLDVVINEVQS